MRTLSDRRAEALVARPLPAPEEFDGPLRRRWTLFAPALAACLRETLDRASEQLFEEADQTQANDRRRLAFASATELAALGRTLDSRSRSALMRLFVDPLGLTEAWQSRTGAFALGQSVERLGRGHGPALAALHERLHDREEEEPHGMADQLAGLLDATFDAAELSAHGRNVLCTTWCHRLESILPGLAGARRSGSAKTTSRPTPRKDGASASDGGPRRLAPRPVLDALTRAQLQALEGPATTDLGTRIATRLAASRSPFDQSAADRALREIRAEAEVLAALAEDERVPRATGEALVSVAPVLARVHCEYAPPHAAALRFVGLLLSATIDLGDDGRDPRHMMLDDIAGDVLARFRGDVGDLLELTEDAREPLGALTDRQQELRRRARERALVERRREHARRATDLICERLSTRSELVSFVERAWRSALTQAHLRYGPDSVPWRRMLVLGQALLTARRRDLTQLRPSIADALSLALPDAVEVEATLDDLAAALRAPAPETELPTARTTTATTDSWQTHREDLPWRLQDGRRRWLLVQAREGGGEVLLADALGRQTEWMDASDFDAAVAAGEIQQLDAQALLERYASR